jgi:hypothetical protein
MRTATGELIAQTLLVNATLTRCAPAWPSMILVPPTANAAPTNVVEKNAGSDYSEFRYLDVLGCTTSLLERRLLRHSRLRTPAREVSLVRFMKHIHTIFLIASVCGCTISQTQSPRHVWYCHIAGGGSCTGEMIRCWDTQSHDWTDASHCVAVTAKPNNLVNNQSWPVVRESALHPKAR